MAKVKFDMEYIFNCSPKVLYYRLNTASGLAEWFADDVDVNGKKFTFYWDKAGREAILSFMKENLIVRYNWVDDGSFFEFRITRDELTGDVSLLITDFAEPDELPESRSLWDSQVALLKHVVGS